MMRKVIAVSVALAMLVALAPASLADSGGVQPYRGWIGADSPLYKAKIFVQKMDVYLTFDSTDRMVKQMDYADERLSEALAAAEKNNTGALNSALDELNDEYEELNDTTLAPDINDSDYNNLSAMLYHHQQTFYAMMNNTSANWTIQGRYMVVNDTITKMKNGMPFYYYNGTAYFIPPGQMNKMETDSTYVPPGLAEKGYKRPVPTITNGSRTWPWDEIPYPTSKKANGNGNGKGKSEQTSPQPAQCSTETVAAQAADDPGYKLIPLEPDYLIPISAKVTYQYDAVGNRVQMVTDQATTDYRYDEAGRLVQAGDVQYEYDAAGRLTKKATPDDAVTRPSFLNHHVNSS
jgi:YD repeat-containing protein